MERRGEERPGPGKRSSNGFAMVGSPTATRRSHVAREFAARVIRVGRLKATGNPPKEKGQGIDSLASSAEWSTTGIEPVPQPSTRLRAATTPHEHLAQPLQSSGLKRRRQAAAPWFSALPSRTT